MSEALRQSDRAARAAACRTFDRPVVLEAGAGTGKTSTLVARVISWALGPGWERASQRSESASTEEVAADLLKRIVAITFTERAAVEMAERVALALRGVAGGEIEDGLALAPLPEPTEGRARALALLATLQQLRCSTIHGFCSTLLAQYSLEAGVHPVYTIDADGARRETVVRALVSERLGELYGDPGDPDLLWLAARGFGPEAIVALLDELMTESVRPADLAHNERLGPALLCHVYAAWAVQLDQLLAVAAEARLQEAKGSAGRHLETLAQLRALLATNPEPAKIAALGHTLADALIEKVSEWGGTARRSTQGTKERLAGFESRIQPAARAVVGILRLLRSFDPERLARACRAARPLLELTYRRLEMEGVLSFDELIEKATRLLEAVSEVRRQVREGIDLLLVDEFQDTDPLQCRLLAALALDGSDPKPALFLVGDPKQSIYGWRRADLAAFDQFVGRVEQLGGVRHRLSINHRSVPAILVEVERIAAPLFIAQPGLQPAFQPLLAAERRLDDPGFTNDGRRPIEYWLSGDVENDDAPAVDLCRDREALAIARDLLELQATGRLNWRDVAILMRQGTKQEIYLGALKRAQIPFVVEGDRSFYQRREIIDAAALLATIFDPHDRLSLVTTLRSPLAGVPDAAWLPLWHAGLPEKMAQVDAPWHPELPQLQAMLHDVAAQLAPLEIPGLERIDGWAMAAARHVESIAELRHAFVYQPADRFLEQLRARTLLEETEALRWLGAHRLANLEQLFQRFFAALTQEGGGVQAALRALRRAVRDRADAAEAAISDATLDAVRVLTIHKAKGLTFEHVYIVGLDQLPGGRRDRHSTLVRRRGEQLSLQLFGAPDPLAAELDEAARRVEEVEAVRALYVAITRPVRRLVLCGALRSSGGDPLRRERRSLLDLLSARRGGLPPAGADRAAADEWLDDDAIRWRRLRDDDAELGAVGIAPAATSFDANMLAAEVERWEGRRRTAQQIMERSWLATASSERIDVDDADEESAGDRASDLAPDVARRVGTAFHRLLESCDLAAPDAAEELARVCTRLVATLPGDLAEPLRHLAETFAAGPLMARWRQVAGRVAGREVPIALASDGAGAGQPLAAYVGAIDLLYRDPETDEWVVADYKTDDLADDAALRERSAHYQPQLTILARAVQRGLALPRPPRAELWFVRHGTCQTVNTAEEGSR